MKFNTTLLLILAAAVRTSFSIPTKTPSVESTDRTLKQYIPRAPAPANYRAQGHKESSSLLRRAGGTGGRRQRVPKSWHEQNLPEEWQGKFDAGGNLIIEPGSTFVEDNFFVAVGPKLGAGGNGDVFLVNYGLESNSKQGALKVSRGTSILPGAKIQASIKHRNVVKVLKQWTIRDEDDRPTDREALVTEYMDRGDLVAWFEKSFEQLPRDIYSMTVGNMMLGATDGVRAVHKAGYAHRDIKPGNLMVKHIKQRQGEMKDQYVAETALNDFDLAKIEKMSQDNPGTPRFQPPEVKLKKSVSRQGLDIWALLATTVDLVAPRKLGAYGQRLVDHDMIGGGKSQAEWAAFLGMSSVSIEFRDLLNKGFRKRSEWMSLDEFEVKLRAITNFWGDE